MRQAYTPEFDKGLPEPVYAELPLPCIDIVKASINCDEDVMDMAYILTRETRALRSSRSATGSSRRIPSMPFNASWLGYCVRENRGTHLHLPRMARAACGAAAILMRKNGRATAARPPY